jgi:hypothetical protein
MDRSKDVRNAGRRYYQLVFAISFYAFGMSFFFATVGALATIDRPSSVPTSLAYLTIGMLGSMVGCALRTFDKRLLALEQAREKQFTDLTDALPRTGEEVSRGM